MAEFRQRLEHVIVDGVEVPKATLATLMVGIKGDIRDYVLNTRYYYISDEQRTDELQEIQSLINSFRPVKTINPEKVLQEYKQKTDKLFTESIQASGEQFFYNEFVILFYRLSAVDLDNPKSRLAVMESLKPFRMLAEQINLKDEEIKELWLLYKRLRMEMLRTLKCVSRK